VWFAGRADELIKIAGHRIGTIEVETACLQLDMEPGDITTIEDEGSVEEAREAWSAMRAQVRDPRA
jgi:hypothetical protein